MKIKKEIGFPLYGASILLPGQTDKDTSGRQKGKVLRLCLLSHILQLENKAPYF